MELYGNTQPGVFDVEEIERARKFYEGALNLSPSRVGDSSVSYRTGRCELKIQADHDPEMLDAFNPEQPPETGRGAGAVYVLTVANPIERIKFVFAAVPKITAYSLRDGLLYRPDRDCRIVPPRPRLSKPSDVRRPTETFIQIVGNYNLMYQSRQRMLWYPDNGVFSYLRLKSLTGNAQ